MQVHKFSPILQPLKKGLGARKYLLTVMMDYTESLLERVSVHHVGNKTNEEELVLSMSLLETDKTLDALLSRFFLTPFASPEFYSFTFSNGDFTLNPLYIYASRIFEDGSVLQDTGADIARHLYELSVHPQIKPGDLFIAHFSNIVMEGRTVEALGIFKSENKQSFLKLNVGTGSFDLDYEDGINIDKLDKGCLIFNAGQETGFKVCVIDKANKSEAQYWKDSFLQLKPCSDDYHNTKDFLDIAKEFVTKQFAEEFEVTRADQIDLLNRSVNYFKNNETFDKEEFVTEVFQDEKVIEAFNNYDESYREEHQIELSDHFDISAQALKKQARVFKSVLKLDKNFHIYIHGDRELIEQGVDQDGRKYYKIYFEEES